MNSKIIENYLHDTRLDVISAKHSSQQSNKNNENFRKVQSMLNIIQGHCCVLVIEAKNDVIAYDMCFFLAQRQTKLLLFIIIFCVLSFVLLDNNNDVAKKGSNVFFYLLPQKKEKTKSNAGNDVWVWAACHGIFVW